MKPSGSFPAIETDHRDGNGRATGLFRSTARTTGAGFRAARSCGSGKAEEKNRKILDCISSDV